MKRAPQTLHEAITNGFLMAGAHPRPSDAIEEHVLDFLRQKFSVAYLMVDELKEPIGSTILKELARQIGVERE